MIATGISSLLTLALVPLPSPSVGASSLPYDKTAILSCTAEDTFALAFDDGPYAYTQELLGILDKYDAKATFFVNGRNRGNIEDYAPLLQREIEAGHQIGWDHKLRLDEAFEADIRREMDTLDEKLCELIQRSPTYMRPPYMAYDDNVLEILQDYHVIVTDLIIGDTEENATAKGTFKRFKNGVEEGHSLLLAHDPVQMTVEELTEMMLQHLQDNGIKGMVSLVRYLSQNGMIYGYGSECLGDDDPENWYRMCDESGSS
ncbi:glycoside hydrolase/deacetylase [Aspergillus vadensis CBS 113365]|uniref:Glycoside hydrolase/deacetylase n=1 Tax=Aspergillus vadensis (strain CBS 113365 / IMI 142717 / IBT 24658) TaxID=1448311 RepID=A0A319BD63_ASPVC|nr:glycoside hydrolase/deacetylase [Aspergillus vadensis CBS 113365]PYH70625.1 glycoside hydrolase/deacetylase [Aspergillus vadensis CBS 113365]